MNELQFSAMIKEHSPSLRSHAIRYTKNEDDADDLVQDTMIKAIRFYKNFQEGTNIKGWLFVIMRNTFINDHRKNTRKKALITQTDEISSQDLVVSASDNKATGTFIMGDIQKALASIPSVYSTPFTRYFEGHKYQEIADEFGIPIGTVKTRIHMAREMLKKYLKNYQSER
ncbi:RNA polymerase sigma factor [Pedobacter frigidisoli]|uniref:RNA polymerase sigma factor n=1 Tax=Pedobacter frigidisoli TaxID=2530455 RepID=A0A4R0P8M6_9SPHI|nr:RNA polymerase sigma factor [Pedobacter frigidisoli]TCD11017.1 RNA polymerase sigma factor [Pedobacter frigidisoli]